MIIPTYNRAKALPKAIQSVLSQTFKDFEIIIVDDSTDDATEEVIKKFDDERIYYIRRQKREGVSAARNAGIKASNGEFIAFLDDDDEWLPEKLEYQIDVFKKNPDVGLVYTGIWQIGREGQKISYTCLSKRGYLYRELLLPDNIYLVLTILHSPLVKKECFDKVGLFDENLPCLELRDIWLRISEYYLFDFIQQPLLKYHVQGINRITDNLEFLLEGWERFCKKHSVRLNSEPKAKKKFRSQCHYMRAIVFFSHNNIINGMKEITKAVTLNPLNFRYYCTPFVHLVIGIKNYLKLSLLENNLLLNQ